jgi:regulator of sirC expression with transglutaminase-like and TPR domain
VEKIVRNQWISRPLPALLTIVTLLLAMTVYAAAVHAASPAADANPDGLELVQLTVGKPVEAAPSDTVRFEAQVNYRLQTIPEGRIYLFVFEDDEAESVQQTSDPIPVRSGSGRVRLSIDYPVGPEVEMLTVLVGLLTVDEELIGWVATNPFPLAVWAGHAQFEQAMAARLAGNLPVAIEYLSKAIGLSPQTGNLYYWRGDTHLRMMEYDYAIVDFSHALELMPEHRASRLGRGVAWLWKDQWQAAITDLTAVIATDTERDRIAGWAHRARGIALSALDRRTEALADFKAYLAFTPDAPDAAEVAAWILELEALG